MATAESRSAFVSRFDRIWAQARRVQLSQALCWGVLTALAGIALLAAVDYWWELPRALRIGALAAIAIGAVAVAASMAVQSVRRWQRQATAAAIEQVFPQLGQRIRTTVQFGELSTGQIEGEGVATTLVGALEADTVRRAEPLPLDAVVPWKSLAVASLLAAIVGLSLAGASALDWEWRAAAQRAFLGEEPYTKITVEPGNLTLKEGESAVILVTVEGRIGKQVSFWSRTTDGEGSEWTAEPLSAEEAEQKDERSLTFEVPLARVKHPLEYRISAGSASSETYRIDVLYPLKIAAIRGTLRSPEYTRLGEQVVEGGNITALAGTQVKLEVELDREPKEAWLEMGSLAKRRDPQEPAMTKIPLSIQGGKLSTDFELTSDQTYSVVAKAADGMELPENKFRIRVRQDEPPQVWFESPAEALEVHSLVEVLMRIRVSDDFGLSRAGIMFEVNNEEEYPLLVEDFQAVKEELEKRELTAKTRATLEKLLPLEHFQLTAQDSVMYYAFAEDSRPGSAQRTESDLRFVDIRPFRRLYRLIDSEDGMQMGNGSQLKSLGELIARQRYALNRTMQLEKRFKHTGQADLAGTDSMVKFEGELAKFTRELAEGLEARGVDPSETELLYQAETSMLGATDSLSSGNYETATLQERDALKFLIEGRIRLEVGISKNRDRRQLAQLRNFDRSQRQKLRRPKSDEEEAKEVAERLKQLADEEDFVYATLTDAAEGGRSKEQANSGQSQDPKEPMTKPSEKGDSGQSPKPAQVEKKPTEPQEGTEGKGETPDESKGSTRQELEDKQLDIAVEARQIEKILGRLDGITDLTKERIGSAAKAAEEAAEAIGQGKMDEARQATKDAGGQFRELTDQVKALLAQEQADRVAAAQQMSAQLSRQQEDFADRLADETDQPGVGNAPRRKQDEKTAGSGKEEKPRDEERPGLAGDAQRIAERAKTLADVLAAASSPRNPEDQPSADKVKELMGTIGLPDLTQRLQQLPDQVAAGKLEEAKANVGDGAERLDAAAEQLSAIHRAIVSPQLDELAKAEAKLEALDQELDQLETPTEITGWHMNADDLLDELDKLNISKELRDQFVEEMKKGGWGPDVTRRGWPWGRVEGGYYIAPNGYRVLLSRLGESLRGRIQELVLGDLTSSRDEPIPPQYQELVDRYYQILASEGKALPKPQSPPQK